MESAQEFWCWLVDGLNQNFNFRASAPQSHGEKKAVSFMSELHQNIFS